METKIDIVYAKPELIPSFHATLDAVARERVFLEMIETKSLEHTSAFQKRMIQMNWPVYYAVTAENRVVGWADISGAENPRLDHRGGLGMGVLREYRGRGLGSRLLEAVLHHAPRSGFEKVELTVYTDNAEAVALYNKFGFVQEGLIQKYRKLDGRYFDVFHMGKFL